MKNLSPESSIDNIEMSNTIDEPLAPVDVTMKWVKLDLIMLSFSRLSEI